MIAPKNPPPPGYISKAEAEVGRFLHHNTFTHNYFAARDRRILVDGPLGTGKTRLGLERVRGACLKYPGCRWLLLRSVRKWLTHSALVTWEEKVLEAGLLVPDKVKRNNRNEYTFKNGSSVVCGGLDDPQSVFSAEYDGALLIEATEVSQDIVEKVDGRLRYGRMPYQQFLMDCNPGPPTHWLHRAWETGYLRRMPMTHRDNPALFLPDGTQTRFGREYLSRLDDLTGVRKARLAEGKWVQAEGVVYEGWNANIHVIDRFPVPPHWRRFWSIDFGFTNPLCWQFWAMDGDGRIYLTEEIYQTKRLVRDVAEWAMRIQQNQPRPEAIITDHDPEAMEHIRQVCGITPTPADKVNRVGGIQDVADRLKIAGDGKPRLFVFRDALQHVLDADLLATGKPTRTEVEFDSYVWNPRLAKAEEPLKEHDHGMDATRYLCKHLNSVNLAGPFDGYGAPSPDDAPHRLPGDTFR
jgi:PBSX family phage terminase large subunit